MTDEEYETLAREIADELILEARMSGDEPIVWATGPTMFPPWRDIPAIETVFQSEDNEDGQAFAYLTETLEQYLEDADIFIGTSIDGSIYIVDQTRFESVEDPDDTHVTLQDDWRMYNPGVIQ